MAILRVMVICLVGLNVRHERCAKRDRARFSTQNRHDCPPRMLSFLLFNIAVINYARV